MGCLGLVLQLWEEGAESKRGSLSLSLLRMGANHSKERPQEGVLSQMKNLLKSPNNNRPVVVPAVAAVRRSTSRSSSVGSPPPSPRTLADTLTSPKLQASFLQFLQDLDHNDPTVPPDHCGRAGSLEFALAVKQLRIGGERNRPEDWVRFFPREKATGLALNNDPQLWQRCAEATRKEELSEEDLQTLLLAREHCVRKLLKDHEEFVRQRATEKATTMSQLASCCVLL